MHEGAKHGNLHGQHFREEGLGREEQRRMPEEGATNIPVEKSHREFGVLPSHAFDHRL